MQVRLLLYVLREQWTDRSYLVDIISMYFLPWFLMPKIPSLSIEWGKFVIDKSGPAHRGQSLDEARHGDQHLAMNIDVGRPTQLSRPSVFSSSDPGVY